MKYEYDMLEIEARGFARGVAIGEFKAKLKLAQEMVETLEFDYISKFLKLPIEYIEEINNGCSVEDMFEKYFVYEPIV